MNQQPHNGHPVKIPPQIPKWGIEFRRVIVSSVITGVVSACGALYLAGVRSEAARQEVQQIIRNQVADHDAITKLTGAMQKIVEDHEKQLGLHTQDINRLKTDIVPRSEHLARWSGEDVWKAEIKQDLREQRQDIKEILTNVKK